MGQTNIFYKTQPINGISALMHISEILAEVKSGEISLTHLFWVNSFEHIYAFQIPEIHHWMLSLFLPFISGDSSSQIPFSSFKTDDKNWCVYRKEKDDLFGPISLSNIMRMKKDNYIFDNDLCFSLKEKSFFFASKLPEVQISPKEKNQPFYFQRRSQRFNELYSCNLIVEANNHIYDADLIDFSDSGAAISSEIEFKINEILELTITVNEKTFKHKAEVRSIGKDKQKTRYGLFLLGKGNATLKYLKNEKKAA